MAEECSICPWKCVQCISCTSTTVLPLRAVRACCGCAGSTKQYMRYILLLTRLMSPLRGRMLLALSKAFAGGCRSTFCGLYVGHAVHGDACCAWTRVRCMETHAVHGDACCCAQACMLKDTDGSAHAVQKLGTDRCRTGVASGVCRKAIRPFTNGLCAASKVTCGGSCCDGSA